MNSMTNNNNLKSGDEVSESDRCKYTIDERNQGDRSPKVVHSTLNVINQSETFAPTPDAAMPSNNSQDVSIVQVMCMFELQKTVIDELKSKMNQMEVELKVQKIFATREMASIREKCEQSQHRSQVPEDVPPRNSQLILDHSQTEWDKLLEENAALKKQNDEQQKEINSLKSTIAERLESLEIELLTRLNDSKRDATDREDTDCLTSSAKPANFHEDLFELMGSSEMEAVHELEYIEVVKPTVGSVNKKQNAISPEVEFNSNPINEYEYEPENHDKITGITFVDTCVFSSAKCHEELEVIEDVSEASAGEFYSGDGDNYVWMDNVSIGKYVSTEDVDNSPLLAENDDAVRLENATENDSNEDEPRLSYFSKHDELAKRLRLSNNPAVQKLKYIDAVNQTTVHCYIELLDQIADEEQLSLFYDTFIIPVTNQKNTATVELTVSPLEGSVLGYGESLHVAQQDAAYTYLARFKLMLME